MVIRESVRRSLARAIRRFYALRRLTFAARVAARSRKMRRMSEPSFVHLRLHSEYSVVDGIVRLDEAVDAAVADRMPALALTDLAQRVRPRQVLQRRRARAGVKPIAGCDVWITNETDRDKPYRLLLLCQNHAGYLTLCELLTRAYRAQPPPRPRRAAQELVRGDRHRRPDRALRARITATSGRRCSPTTRARPQALAARMGRRFSRTATTSSCSASGQGAMTSGAAARAARSARAARGAARGGARAAAGRDAPDPVRAGPTTSARTKRACASPKATSSPTSAGRRPFTASSISRRRPRWPSSSRTFPKRSQNSVEIAKRCNLKLTLGKSQLPRFPTPGRTTASTTTCSARALEGLEQRLEALYPDAAEREQERPRYVARLDFELATIMQMGFPGYFLIVADFINWAKTNGVPVGPGPRLGRRLARRLQPRHHRSRSAALQPALRALPESRARVDARLRHRLLPGRARSRHRLREEQVRRGQRLADRDVRHDGREGGGARRRPRARPRLQLLRPAREADPVPARQAHHARRRARDGAAAEGAREERGGSRRAARARGKARRPHAQRRHARGRRADRAGQAHRFLSAVYRRRLATRRSASTTRTTSRRSGWSSSTFSASPRSRSSTGRCATSSSSIPSSTLKLEELPLDDADGVPHVLDREHERRVPVRIARHARHAEAREARPLRRHHRARRAVSPGPDGPDPVVLRAQARARARRLSRPARRADPLRDLRHHGLPGAGDADGADHRRLQPRRRRPAAPRDGQEEARGDGASTARSSAKARRRTASPSTRPTSSST